jgi:hypothetical protein
MRPVDVELDRLTAMSGEDSEPINLASADEVFARTHRARGASPQPCLEALAKELTHEPLSLDATERASPQRPG